MKKKSPIFTLFTALCGSVFISAQSTAQLKNLTLNDQNSFMTISHTAITPGQLRYSKLNVQEKIAALKTKGALSTPLPVILAPFGPVLVDGHHDTLACIALGIETIPVFVMKDFSHLSVDEFWRQATTEGLVYPYTLDNRYKIPTNFDALEDDPNRFFAALVARKCTKDKNGIMVAIASPKTALGDYPVWIKFGNKIPFIEFKISDTLKAHGIIYDNAWGENVPESFVENARRVLVDNPIPGLKIIATRTAIKDGSPESYAVCQ